MFWVSKRQLEHDLEEQDDGLRMPKRVLVRPDRIQTTRQPPTDNVKANAGAKRLNRSQSLAVRRPSESQQKKGQVVFICGGDHDLTRWAIQVNVHAAAPRARRLGSKPENPCDCESCDVAIYQNLNRAFWAQVGPWSRYIPFYGIVKVEEVKFQIHSLRKDRYGILLEHLDYKRIEEEAKSRIDLAQNSQDGFTNDICVPEMNLHSKSCLNMMDFADDPADDPCFLKQAEEAHLRLKGLKSLGFLTEHFKSPLTAAEGSSLKGLAQKSCVYDERSLRIPQSPEEAHKDTRSYRGLNPELGWHTTAIPPKGDLIATVVGVLVAAWKYMNGDLDAASALGIFLAILAPYGFKNLRMD